MLLKFPERFKIDDLISALSGLLPIDLRALLHELNGGLKLLPAPVVLAITRLWQRSEASYVMRNGMLYAGSFDFAAAAGNQSRVQLQNGAGDNNLLVFHASISLSVAGLYSAGLMTAADGSLATAAPDPAGTLRIQATQNEPGASANVPDASIFGGNTLAPPAYNVGMERQQLLASAPHGVMRDIGTHGGPICELAAGQALELRGPVNTRITGFFIWAEVAGSQLPQQNITTSQSELRNVYP